MRGSLSNSIVSTIWSDNYGTRKNENDVRIRRPLGDEHFANLVRCNDRNSGNLVCNIQVPFYER
jgi:hypothetical protein